jgi:hypothetical protein
MFLTLPPGCSKNQIGNDGARALCALSGLAALQTLDLS